MTTHDHNKLIAILHLIYGGMNALGLVVMLLFFGFFGNLLGSLPQRGGDDVPVAFFVAIMGFVTVLMALFTIPPLIAGYGLLKRRSWARIAGIIAGAMSGLSFPLGTALCVYTLWFLLGDEGRAFYDRNASAYAPTGQLRDASHAQWQDARTYTERERRQDAYTPPQQPPDWRG